MDAKINHMMIESDDVSQSFRMTWHFFYIRIWIAFIGIAMRILYFMTLSDAPILI